MQNRKHFPKKKKNLYTILHITHIYIFVSHRQSWSQLGGNDASSKQDDENNDDHHNDANNDHHFYVLPPVFSRNSC